MNFIISTFSGVLGSAIFGLIIFIIPRIYKFIIENNYDANFKGIELYIYWFENPNIRSKKINSNYLLILQLVFCMLFVFIISIWIISSNQLWESLKVEMIRAIISLIGTIFFCIIGSFVLGLTESQRKLVHLSPYHIDKKIRRYLKKYNKKIDEERKSFLLEYLEKEEILNYYRKRENKQERFPKV